MPDGALGTADDSVKVLDPETGEECPTAAFDDKGLVANLDVAVGEIVETQPSSGFEGYYRNDDRHRRAVPRRRLLVRRPRLPRRRRLALLRRPVQRVAPGRRRELLRRARRVDHRPPPRRPLRRRVRGARRPGRRPGHGRPRAVGRRHLRPGGVRPVPRRADRPRAQVGAGVRPGRRRAAEAVEPEDRQEGAPQPRVGDRRRRLALGPGRGPAGPHRGGSATLAHLLPTAASGGGASDGRPVQ